MFNNKRKAGKDPPTLENKRRVHKETRKCVYEDQTAVKRQRRSKATLLQAVGTDPNVGVCKTCEQPYTLSNAHKCKFTKKKGFYITTQSVMVALSKRLTSKYREQVATKLQDYLERYTRILILGTRFMQLHITRLLQEKVQFELTQNFVKRCLIAVTSNPAKIFKEDQQLKETYDTLWPANVLPPSKDTLSSFSLQGATRSLFTSFKTMTKTHFEKRQRFWIRHRFENGEFDWPLALNVKQRNAFNQACFVACLESKTDEEAQAHILRACTIHNWSVEQAEHVCKQMWQQIVGPTRRGIYDVWHVLTTEKLERVAEKQAYRLAKEAKTETASMKKKESETVAKEGALLPWLYRIINDLDTHNATLSEGTRQSRLFPLSPVVQFTTPMMPMCVTFWQKIATDIGVDNWQKLFNFPRSLKRLPANQMITTTFTDGVSIVFVSETQHEGERPFEDKQKLTYITDESSEWLQSFENLVVIDPGRKSPYMALSSKNALFENNDNVDFHPLKKDVTKVGVSKKEWADLRLFRRHPLEREQWLVSAPNVQQVIVAIPSPKGCVLQKLYEHATYIIRHLDLLRNFYGARRFARQRLQAYIAKQKAWHTVIQKMLPTTVDEKTKKRVADKDALSKTLFGLGDGAFSHTSKGHSATPTAKRQFIELRKAGANVRWIHEFRTSKMCSNCHHEVTEFKQSQEYAAKEVIRLLNKGYKAIQKECKKGNGSECCSLEEASTVCKNAYRRVLKPWGVRVCTNCRTRHCRDVNACRNMLYLFYHAACGLPRPSAYSRHSSQPVISVCSKIDTYLPSPALHGKSLGDCSPTTNVLKDL
jgi:hypothetical protein